tara:strand:- start:100 stop:579 length:480 start_codon:yes stop_codon:yes gene_type:complete
MKVKIEKNFLDQKNFNDLKKISLDFPFYFADHVAYENHKDGYYFTHTIYEKYQVNSQPAFQLIMPILYKLKAKALWRAKINLYPSTNKIIEHKQHKDTDFKCKTFLISLNTCNGFTRIGKNIKVPSIENQGVFFDSMTPHNSTTCTDESVRLNININYF